MLLSTECILFLQCKDVHKDVTDEQSEDEEPRPCGYYLTACLHLTIC